MISYFWFEITSDEFIKERERYATIGDDLDLAFVELIGCDIAYNDRHPKPPTPKLPTPPPAPPKEPTPPGELFGARENDDNGKASHAISIIDMGYGFPHSAILALCMFGVFMWSFNKKTLDACFQLNMEQGQKVKLQRQH